MAPNKRPPRGDDRNPRGADRNAGRPVGRDGEPGPTQWGALARRGSRRLAEDVRDAGNKPPQQGPPAPKEPEDVWVRDDVRSTAERAVGRANRAQRPAKSSSNSPQGASHSKQTNQPARDDERAESELARAVGPQRAGRAVQRLGDATRSFERERYTEARRVLRQLAEDAPNMAAVRELLGLTYYRLGQWTQAVRELEAFRTLTGSTEQNPVLADCYRALKRWAAVDDLWEELRQASPSPDLVAEGRIVMAGALADRRLLSDAVRLLEQSPRRSKRPQIHHLRVAYALADLRERSGDVPGARELFDWVSRNEPDFADAKERSRALA